MSSVIAESSDQPGQGLFSEVDPVIDAAPKQRLLRPWVLVSVGLVIVMIVAAVIVLSQPTSDELALKKLRPMSKLGTQLPYWPGVNDGDLGSIVITDGVSILASGWRPLDDADNFRHRLAMLAKLSADGSLTWAKTFGGSGRSSFRSVAVTDDGSIFAVGDNSSLDGDLATDDCLPAPDGRCYDDAVVAKISPDGDLVWVKTFGGSRSDSFNAVVVAPDDSLIVTGYTESSDGDFPATECEVSLFGGDTFCKQAAIVAKLTKAGDLVWVKTYSRVVFGSVAFTSDGGIIVAGSTASPEGDLSVSNCIPGENRQDDCLSTALVVKLATDGDLVWAKTYDWSWFDLVTIAPDNSLVVVENIWVNDYIPNWWPYRSAASLAKLTADGDLVWTVDFDQADLGWISSVAITNDGSVIAVGSLSWTINHDVGVTYQRQAILAKISADGSLVWTYKYGYTGDDYFSSLAIRPDGSLIVIGITEHVYLDGGTHVFSSDVVFSLFTADGQPVW